VVVSPLLSSLCRLSICSPSGRTGLARFPCALLATTACHLASALCHCPLARKRLELASTQEGLPPPLPHLELPSSPHPFPSPPHPHSAHAHLLFPTTTLSLLTLTTSVPAPPHPLSQILSSTFITLCSSTCTSSSKRVFAPLMPSRIQHHLTKHILVCESGHLLLSPM
jgi:hypothetical protein